MSELIKRGVRPRVSANEVLRVLRTSDVSIEMLEATDESIARRRRAPRRRNS
jgi:hypothetical protein